MEYFEIPFGARDSELREFEYTIPEGFVAEIKDGKVIVKKAESEEDELMMKAVIGILGEKDHPRLCAWLKSLKPSAAYKKGYKDGIAANLADLEKEFKRGYDFAKNEMAEKRGKEAELPRYYGD